MDVFGHTFDKISYFLNCNGNQRNVLLAGPIGCGKGWLASLALPAAQEISYATLLPSTTDKVHESPRQKLNRLLEGVALQCDSNATGVIFRGIGEFMSDSGVWYELSQVWFPRLQALNIKAVSTLGTDDAGSSSNFLLLKEFYFVSVVMMDSSSVDLSAAWTRLTGVSSPFDWNKIKGKLGISDLKFVAKEHAADPSSRSIEMAIDEMIREGRTCAQLSTASGTELVRLDSSNPQNEVNDLRLSRVFGLKDSVKRVLLQHASFSHPNGLNARGILLSGPPGTGKTRLALALAASLAQSTRLIVLAASDLLRAEIGVSEGKLREAFELARASQPALIFFDEVNALFPKDPSPHLRPLLHQLIAEFDALELQEKCSTAGKCRVFLLAATNFPERVNPRLLQAGRFDFDVFIGKPTFSERLDILENDLLREDDENIDWSTFKEGFTKELAKETDDCSPADLVKIVQDARKRSWNRASRLCQIDFSLPNKVK